MYLWMSLFTAVLFFVLTPGVLLRLPPGGSKLAVAAVHAVVFAVVYGLVHKTVLQMLYPEGFMSGTGHTNVEMNACPPGQSKGPDGTCAANMPM
jgi:hypothetical protein